MVLLDYLKSKNIYVEKLHDGGKYLRAQWEIEFTSRISNSVKNKIYFNQYLWHIFSYHKLEHLEREEAREAFNKIKKGECYIFYQNDDEALYIKNASKIRAEDFDMEQDVYIVDKKFTWTYVHTHEEFCGPYFHSMQEKET